MVIFLIEETILQLDLLIEKQLYVIERLKRPWVPNEAFLTSVDVDHFVFKVRRVVCSHHLEQSFISAGKTMASVFRTTILLWTG